MNPFNKTHRVLWRLLASVMLIIPVLLSGCGTQWTPEYQAQQNINQALQHPYQFQQRSATKISPAAFYISPSVPSSTQK